MALFLYELRDVTCHMGSHKDRRTLVP